MKIYCKNTESFFDADPGVTFQELFNQVDIKLKGNPLCVNLNGKLTRMDARVYENSDVEFMDGSSDFGIRVYSFGLVFVLSKAVSELYPGGKVRVSNAVSRGLYCPIMIDRELDNDVVSKINERMGSIIGRNIPFIHHAAHTTEVIEMMKNAGRDDVVDLLETTGKIYTEYYTHDGMPDCYFGILPPSTGCLKVFGLEPLAQGVLLRIPNKEDLYNLQPIVSQKKMFGVFNEHHKWMKILEFSMVGELNKAIIAGKSNMLINVAEALQSNKIVRIADSIMERRSQGKGLKLVMVSGPSSSGKTTFSKRLQVQLLAQGLKLKVLSLDDYFLNRDQTPLDENGEHDFESLYAIDLPFFNSQLKDLLAGKTIQPPTFNFLKGGVREFTAAEMSLDKDDGILLIEGIHALNPNLMPDIPSDTKFLIYVSALTSMCIDEHNYIPTTDNRLLRRITRDYKYRSYSARDTIKRWASVRAGEEKWIFPYQENADAMFNSAMLFEIAVIKDMVDPILAEVPENCPEYTKARQLRDFLKLFHTIPSQNLPPTSLVREFIGGSSFDY